MNRVLHDLSTIHIIRKAIQAAHTEHRAIVYFIVFDIPYIAYSVKGSKGIVIAGAGSILYTDINHNSKVLHTPKYYAMLRHTLSDVINRQPT